MIPDRLTNHSYCRDLPTIHSTSSSVPGLSLHLHTNMPIYPIMYKGIALNCVFFRGQPTLYVRLTYISLFSNVCLLRETCILSRFSPSQTPFVLHKPLHHFLNSKNTIICFINSIVYLSYLVMFLYAFRGLFLYHSRAHCPHAVSYTHLDVYKRQPILLTYVSFVLRIFRHPSASVLWFIYISQFVI